MGANLKPHLFQPGNPGGPGRKLGSRNRLAEVALQALGEHFAQFGGGRATGSR